MSSDNQCICVKRNSCISTKRIKESRATRVNIEHGFGNYRKTWYIPATYFSLVIIRFCQQGYQRRTEGENSDTQKNDNEYDR